MLRFIPLRKVIIAICLAMTVSACGRNPDPNNREAQTGNTKTQSGPASMYEAIQDTARNYAEAIKWYRTSAKQDIEQAQSGIDARYSEIAGLDQDDKGFANRPRLASKQEIAKPKYRHEEAPVASGNIDYEKLVQQDLLAAQAGSAQAQYNLGMAYEHGLGVPQNDKEALKWYQLAAKQGFLKARYRHEAMLRKSQ